jgi:hypothetical protein
MASHTTSDDEVDLAMTLRSTLLSANDVDKEAVQPILEDSTLINRPVKLCQPAAGMV